MNTLVSYAMLLPITVWLVVIGFFVSCSELGDTGTSIQGSFAYADIRMFEGQAIDVRPIWSGASAGQTVTYTINPVIKGVEIYSNGIISVATNAPALSNTFTVTAQGSGGYAGSKTATLLVVVRSVTTFTEGGTTVISMAWSRDGTLLASASGGNTGSGDNNVRIWDPNTGKLLLTLSGHTSRLLSVAWNPGVVLASASADKTIKTWYPPNAYTLRTLTGNLGRVNTIAWNGDKGNVLLAGGDDGNFEIRIWDSYTTSVPLRNLTGHVDQIKSVAWNPAGTRLASGSADNTIKIWDPNNTSALRTLAGHTNQVYSVVWNRKGSRLASGSADSTIKIWDPDNANALFTLTGHAGQVYSVAWDPVNDDRLASGGQDSTIKIWHAYNATPLLTLTGHLGKINTIAWSPDGTRLASGSNDGRIKIWDVSGL